MLNLFEKRSAVFKIDLEQKYPGKRLQKMLQRFAKKEIPG